MTRTVLVIDDDAKVRFPRIKKLVPQNISERVIDYFTKYSASKSGVIAPGISVENIAHLRPALMIFDLALLKSQPGDFTVGIDQIRKVRGYEGTRDIPIFVISDYAADDRASSQLRELKVEEVFDASELNNENPTTVARFRTAVEKVLGPVA